MKKFIVGFAVLAMVGGFAYAGSLETSAKQQTNYQPAPLELFRDREWNFDLFGTYAFTARPYQSDRYLGVDHAWGGGMDANYMFTRYLGLGVEGYGLAADDAVGQASGNLIFRYPIPRTHLAPYGYAGGGVIFNGSDVDDLVDRHFHRFDHHNDAEAMGQFGAGIELRLTPNIGFINDFSWNIVNGDRNDFGLVRSGLRFAF